MRGCKESHALAASGCWGPPRVQWLSTGPAYWYPGLSPAPHGLLSTAGSNPSVQLGLNPEHSQVWPQNLTEKGKKEARAAAGPRCWSHVLAGTRQLSQGLRGTQTPRQQAAGSLPAGLQLSAVPGCQPSTPGPPCWAAQPSFSPHFASWAAARPAPPPPPSALCHSQRSGCHQGAAPPPAECGLFCSSTGRRRPRAGPRC